MHDQQADRALAQAPGPARAAPVAAGAWRATAGARSEGRREIARVLLATDLSPASEPATEQAIALARDLGAELLVVSVIDEDRTPSAPGAPPPMRIDQRRSSRELAAQAIVSRGRSEGVTVSFLVWQGEPGRSIVEAAAAEAVDLIVVGTRGHNRLERAVLGSVSDHVVRHAPCPVLIVRDR